MLTSSGYHIIKRLALTAARDSVNVKTLLHQQVLKDNRIDIAKKAMIEKIYRVTRLSPARYNEEQVLKLYRDSLEKYNPDFAAQLKDVKEGNLLFEIMQTKIWSKAANDSIGAHKYYIVHKSKYKGDYAAVRGLVISDYQAFLEEKWIEALKRKYPVKIYW